MTQTPQDPISGPIEWKPSNYRRRIVFICCISLAWIVLIHAYFSGEEGTKLQLLVTDLCGTIVISLVLFYLFGPLVDKVANVGKLLGKK